MSRKGMFLHIGGAKLPLRPPSGSRMPDPEAREHVLDPESRRFQARVRQVIVRRLAQGPNIVGVAEDLSLNVRTLQRRLAETGAPFRSLLDQCRRERALRELESGRKSVGEIASMLGYSDPSHFVRAFNRWTGQAPIRYRSKSPPESRS